MVEDTDLQQAENNDDEFADVADDYDISDIDFDAIETLGYDPGDDAEDSPSDDPSQQLLPHVAGFLDAIEKIFCENARALNTIGGNFMLHLRDRGLTWVFVTEGKRFGIYDEPTEDPIECAVICVEGLLEDLLANEEVDFEEANQKGWLHIEGNFDVFDRFLAFNENKSPLSIRLQ